MPAPISLLALVAALVGAAPAAAGPTDTTPPAAPTLTGIATTTPLVPAYEGADYGTDPAPAIVGSAESGSTVVLVASCGEPGENVVATGSAATLASPGISFSPVANTWTRLAARAVDDAGNRSDCSAPRQYFLDTEAPGIPSMQLSWGQSQAWEGTSPSVQGYTSVRDTSNAGNPILVYDNAGCTGIPVGTTGVRKAGFWGVNVTVRADATTPLYAVEVDQVGHRSPCPAEPQVSYIHITARDPAVFPPPGPTPSPSPSPAVQQPQSAALPPLTLFAKSLHCVSAAGAKAKRPLPLSLVSSAPATFTVKVERSTTKKVLHTCPAAVGRGTGAAFRPIFSDLLTDFSSAPAGDGGLAAHGSVAPKQALGAGLYRLTATARAADGRTATAIEHFWVLHKR